MDFRQSPLFRLRTARFSIISVIALALLGAVLALTNGSSLSAGAITTATAGASGTSLCYGEVAVPQENADTATIIDQHSNLITHTIGVEAQPTFAHYSGDGRFLFVSSFNAHSIDVVDTSTNTVLRTLSLGAVHPLRFVSNFDGSILWVNLYDGTNYTLQKIDAVSGAQLVPQVAFGQAYSLLLSPDETTLWIAQSSLSVDMFELNAMTLVTQSITLMGGYGWSFSMNSDGTTIYMADPNGTGVLVFDTATKAVTQLGTITDLRELVVSPSGTTLYGVRVNGWPALQAVAIDTTTGAVTQGVNINSLVSGGATNGLAITADGTKLYYSYINYANGGLVVVETANFNTGTFIPLEIYTAAATCPLAADPTPTVPTTVAPDPVAPAFTG